MTPAERQRLRALVPLQAGAAAAVLAGVIALTATVASLGLGPLMVLAMVAGLCASVVSVWRNIRHGWGASMMVAGAFFLGLARIMGASVGGIFYPPEVIANSQLLLATTFVWAAIACCFNLTGTPSAYFAVGLTFTAFGLVAPENLNAEIPLSFFAYCLAGIFVLGYGRQLDEQRQSPDARPGDVGVQARPVLLSAGLVLLLAGLGGLLVGNGLYRAAPQLFVKLGARMAGASSRLSPSSYAQLGVGAFAVGKGPVRLSDRPVMVVDAPSGRLWRGAVYDRYTGSGWDRWNTREEWGRHYRHSGRWRTWRRLPTRAREPLVQKVSFVGVGQPLAFAAAEPAEVRLPLWFQWQVGGVRFDAYNCARFDALGATDLKYTVVSQVSRATPSELAGARLATPSEIGRRYFSLPISTQADAKQISDRIVAGLTNPYAKAQAIRDFLAANYTYTTNGPYIPQSRDAVIEFLTSERRGACDLFASAFVVLARAQGIPARVATGYATGEYSQQDGGFLVRENDAHAWAEVCFADYGWIPFDPTAGASRDPRSLLVLLKIGAYGRFVAATLKRALPIILGGALLAWVLTSVLGLDLRALSRRLRRRTPQDRVTEAYLRACHLFAKRGCRRSESAAPGEFLAEVSAHLCDVRPLAVSGLARLTDVFIRARYGPHSPSAGDFQEAQRALRRIHLGLRRRRPRAGPGLRANPERGSGDPRARAEG